MKRSLIMSAGLALVLAGGALAQDTTTTTVVTKKDVVVHPDGSYTVIEYPVGREVTVNLLPGTSLTGAKGVARVMRSADGTKVHIDLAGVTGDASEMYVYSIDPAGVPTLLGPVKVTNGAGVAEFTTTSDKFMLVVSPTGNLTAVDTSTPIFFRSELPKGYAIVPRRMTGEENAVAGASNVGSTYEVPMLNVPGFKAGETTEVRIKFSGDLKGLDGRAYLKPEGGKTTIKMRFGDMRKVPANTRFVLWAKAPDGSYTKLGQVINTGSRDESEIRSETALTDFGLFMTVEDADVADPTGKVYSVFGVPRVP
ncbi:MAG: hypothetical protein ACK4S4_01460 [Pyrinomonadaceae bacterium]